MSPAQGFRASALRATEIAVPILAVGLALLAGSGARAQDPYAAGGTTQDWNGFYAGLHAGGGFGDAGPVNTSGFVGGAQAGYNAQFDRVVVGAEVDASASSVGHNSFVTKYRQNWTTSLRARAGVTVNQALIYGTAGVAYSSNEFKDAAGKSTSRQGGFVAGAGAELKVSERVLVRGEALHYNFGDGTHPSIAGPIAISPTTNVLRGGVNLRF